MICTTCDVWYDPHGKCDHRILVGVPVYLCPKCDWRVRLGLDLGMDWLPPCSVCGSQMEGVRIIKKELKP